MNDDESTDDQRQETPDGERGLPEGYRDRVESDPFCRTLGIELTELRLGHARTRLTVTAEMLNFHGTIHGGVTYTLADAAFAAASNSRGRRAVALETNISYLAPVDVGTTLLATASENHRSKRTAEYEVVVMDDAENRVSTFRGRAYRP